MLGPGEKEEAERGNNKMEGGSGKGQKGRVNGGRRTRGGREGRQ